MRLFPGFAMLAVLLPGPILAQDGASSLRSAVEELTREWFAGQLGDLPSDEAPEQDVLIVDIAEMTDDVTRRVSDVLRSSDALAGGVPDDAANAAAMAKLVEEYEGLESTTTAFTQLALSKASDPAYQSGWRLCAIRVIAESWLPQAREMRAQRDVAAQPRCEPDLKAEQSGMLPLQPNRTEFSPGGSATIEFTVEPTGTVSNLSFVEWSVTPSEELMQDYVARSVQSWKFPARENACRRQTTIAFKTAGDE